MKTPDGWTEAFLGDLLAFSNGINAGKSAYGSGVPFANVLEVITNESLREADIPGSVTLPQKMINRYLVQHGDMLFNRTSETQNEVGLASVYVGERPVVFGGFVFRGRHRTVDFDYGYAKFALRESYVRDQITSRGQGGIRANLGQRDLKLVSVILPPVEEQRTIAEAIDDAANQIRTLEHLVAKKRAIKQGLMYQLLYGRTRTADFSGSADEVSIGSMTTWLSGGTPNRSEPGFWGGNIPWISAATLKHVRVHDSDQHLTTAGLQSGSRLAPVGAVLVLVRGMALHHEARIGITGQPVSFNQDIKALISRPGILPEYLAYSLIARERQILDLVSSAGSGTGVLNTDLLKALQVWLPEKREQQAIVAVLTDADTEVAALQTRLDKARAVKQGMMQQLLTGKIRLPTPDSTLKDAIL